MSEKGNKTNIRDILPTNMKVTGARIAIIDILQSETKALSADDIYNRLVVQQIKTNLSTVYRTLEKFVDCDIISKNFFPNDSTAFYTWNDKDDEFDTFTCVNCKSVTHIKAPAIDEKAIEENSDGCQIISHKVELFGYCKTCSDHKHND